MTTACEKFIALPELISSLVPLLSKTDLSRLSRTNRELFQNCAPLLWLSLDLQQPPSSSRLLDSPEGQKELKNNIDFVRAVSWGSEFSDYYFQALWLYLTNSTTTLPLAHQSIPTDALSHENWGAVQNVVDVSSVTPLPPLLALTRFEISTPEVPIAEQRRTQLPTYTYAKHLHQNLWLARLNCETLTHLEYTFLHLQSAQVVRDLCRTISQLVHLLTLRLGTQSYYCRAESHRMLEIIFFSCPGSLVELSLGRMRAVSESSFLNLDPDLRDWDFDQGPLVLRATPLRRLKTLRLPQMSSHPDLASALHSLLEHCPAIETFGLPYADGSFIGFYTLIDSLGELSSLISDLSLSMGCSGEFLLRILRVLTPRRLKSLYCCFQSDLKPDRVGVALARHSATLRQIELIDSRRVPSAIIQVFLTTCSGLEVFRVTDHCSGYIDTCLSMTDAVESDWACRKIRHLEIGILMGGRCPQYLNDPSCATWTETDYRHWELLGRLYAQIGLLTQLEVLELEAVRWKGMPIGLGVEDEVRGKKVGHLEMLSGLTELRKIRGIYPWVQGDDRARIGEREAEWFMSNLPRLRLINFALLSDSEGSRMLRAGRPWLKLRVARRHK